MKKLLSLIILCTLLAACQRSASMEEKKDAAMKLTKYVTISKDSVFSLSITKDEAKSSLGIENNVFDCIMDDIEDTNKRIKDANKRGEQIELDDYFNKQIK